MDSAWQPIETADKTARKLLLWADGRFQTGCWDDDAFAKKPRPFWRWSFTIDKSYQRVHQPTHWMIPDPPIP